MTDTITRIRPGIYRMGLYIIRRGRDEAGRVRWFVYRDGPTQPFAGGDTLQACIATRRATPYMKIDDPPKYRGEMSDRKALAAYQDAFDLWLSETPTIETFRVDGRA